MVYFDFHVQFFQLFFLGVHFLCSFSCSKVLWLVRKCFRFIAVSVVCSFSCISPTVYLNFHHIILWPVLSPPPPPKYFRDLRPFCWVGRGVGFFNIDPGSRLYWRLISSARTSLALGNMASTTRWQLVIFCFYSCSCIYYLTHGSMEALAILRLDSWLQIETCRYVVCSSVVDLYP